MKRLVLILAIIPVIAIAKPKSYPILDLSGLSSDSTIVIPYSSNRGSLIEVDFTETNCNTLYLKFGYGLTDTCPRFPATFSGLTNPVLLDKTDTTLTHTYLGVSHSGVSVDISEYNGQYLYLYWIDNAACTSGEVNIIRDK